MKISNTKYCYLKKFRSKKSKQKIKKVKTINKKKSKIKVVN